MCAPNKTKKRNKALSYLFRIVTSISAVVSGHLGAMSTMEVFFIKHELYVNG